MKVLRLGILGSTRGSNLVPLYKRLQQTKVPFRINGVISNREEAGILQRAAENHWPGVCLLPEKGDREAYDAKLSAELQNMQADLVVLMGYMRILTPGFIARWRHKIINVHPSLLPAFAGKMDLAVHQAVLDSGAKETGCTVHEVSEALDEGPILVQKKCPVLSDDTALTLKSRVQDLEPEAMCEAIELFYERSKHD